MLPERGGEPMDPAPGTRTPRYSLLAHNWAPQLPIFGVSHARRAGTTFYPHVELLPCSVRVKRGRRAAYYYCVTAAPQRALRARSRAPFSCVSRSASSFVSTRSTPSPVHS